MFVFIGFIVVVYKQVLDLGNLSWSSLKLQINPGVESSEGNGGLVESLPPIAGHSMVSIPGVLIGTIVTCPISYFC